MATVSPWPLLFHSYFGQYFFNKIHNKDCIQAIKDSILMAVCHCTIHVIPEYAIYSAACLNGSMVFENSPSVFPRNPNIHLHCFFFYYIRDYSKNPTASVQRKEMCTVVFSTDLNCVIIYDSC